MIIPEKVCESIWKHAKPFLDEPIPDEYTLGSILNAIAYENLYETYKDAEGNELQRKAWGLSRKRHGKNVDSPVGPIAEDILHHKPSNLLFDIFQGADVGLILRPSCGGDIGHPTSADREWVEPVPPVGTIPIPTPIPDPEVPPMPNCKFEPCNCSDKLVRIETAINRIGARLDAVSDKLETKIHDAQDQLNSAMDAKKNENITAVIQTLEEFKVWMQGQRFKIRF